jgi:regulator of cell morphogenesis and NO signaling
LANKLLATSSAYHGTHHVFVREESRIQALADKVVGVGKNHPELLQVQAIFSALAEELRVHLMKEEQVLSPTCC